MRKLVRFVKDHIAIFLIITCSMLAYGVLLPWLGLYTDDWIFLNTYHNFGSKGLFDYFRIHRPVWGLTYQIAMPFLGTKAWVWHIYGLSWRLITSLAFYWLLRLVWPQRKKFSLMAGLLFAIYPGYLLQPLSLVMGHVVLVYAVFILSLVFTILAIQCPNNKIVYSTLALLGSLFNITAMEYFLPLEVIRLVLIYLVLPKNKKVLRRIWDSLAYWLPYALILLSVTIYRAFFYQPQTKFYSLTLMDSLKSNVLGTLLQLGKDILNSIYQSSVYTWIQPLISLENTLQKFNKLNLVIFGFFLAAFLLVLFATLRLVDKEINPRPSKVDWSPLIISLIALFIAGWPFYVTGLMVMPSGFYSRFTLPFIFGSAILGAFLLDEIKVKWITAVIFSIFVSSGIVYHFATQNTLRMVTFDNTRMIYELTWRIPGLQPGATVVTNEGSEYFTYSTLAAQLNLIYPLRPDEKISYGWIWPKELSQLTSNPITKGQTFTEDLIPYPFSGNTNQLVVIQVRPNSCLRVITPDSIKVEKSLVDYGLNLISDQTLIDLNQKQQGIELSAFGNEPEHGWCYYFEKADMALQKGDFGAVVEYYSQVQENYLTAMQPEEWLPFIEGLGKAGKAQEALEISNHLISSQPGDKQISFGVCAAWARIIETNPRNEALLAMKQWSCP